MKLLVALPYHRSGRMRGYYVYLLMCEEGESLFIKIGAAQDPIRRIHNLLVGCPLEPGILATAEFPTRKRAYQAERAIHGTFREWRARGEWFRFHIGDRDPFNARLREAVREFHSPSWPIKWTQLDAQKLLRARAVSGAPYAIRYERLRAKLKLEGQIPLTRRASQRLV